MNINWKLRVGERTFTIADLSVGDASLVQQLTGDGWRSLDPTAGPNHAGNLLAVLVASEGKVSLEAALQQVAAMSTVDLLTTVLDAGAEPVEDAPAGD